MYNNEFHELGKKIYFNSAQMLSKAYWVKHTVRPWIPSIKGSINYYHQPMLKLSYHPSLRTCHSISSGNYTKAYKITGTCFPNTQPTLAVPTSYITISTLMSHRTSSHHAERVQSKGRKRTTMWVKCWKCHRNTITRSMVLPSSPSKKKKCTSSQY